MLSIEPDTWLRRSNPKLAGEIRLQQKMHSDIKLVTDKPSTLKQTNSTSIWHGIVKIENKSESVKYVERIEFLFTCAKSGNILATSAFGNLKQKIFPNQIYQFGCQFRVQHFFIVLNCTVFNKKTEIFLLIMLFFEIFCEISVNA